MSASLKPADRRTTERSKRKQLAAQKKREIAAARAAKAEENDEKLAPGIQRHAILGRDGQVVKGARLERDGVSFRVSNPISHLVARSRNREFPLLTRRHSEAADRLRICFEEGGGGISAGCSNYEPKMSSTPSTGVISDAVLQTIHHQIAARVEVEAVRTCLGPLWGIIYSIAILGVDVQSWSTTVNMNPDAAGGMLAGALDRLVAYYNDAEPERRSRIRSVEFSPSAPEAA